MKILRKGVEMLTTKWFVQRFTSFRAHFSNLNLEEINNYMENFSRLQTYLFKETVPVIHQGGLGKRMTSVTQGKFPKTLLEVGYPKRRPIMEWILLPYVRAGFEEIYVTLWFKPDSIKRRCKEIEKYAREAGRKLEFTFIEEPQDGRLGRAGAIRYGLEKGIIPEGKNILSLNGSDIVKYDIEDFGRFHLEGLEKGFFVSVVGSPYDKSKFGRIYCEEDGRVKEFEEKPLIRLPKGVYSNVGIFLFDKKAIEYFYELEEFPVDIETSPNLSKLNQIMRCYSGKKEIVPGKSWVWFKDRKDYERWENVDYEKFLGISPVEKYLGPYEPRNLGNF